MRTDRSRKRRNGSAWSWSTSTSSCPVLPTRRPSTISVPRSTSGCAFSYKPKPITGRLTREITNIPLRHFVWNISERFMYKKYYNGDNRANFIKTLFPREFADTDIATIKNFKVDPSKTLIPIDEPENGSLDFHYPEDYARKVNS